MVRFWILLIVGVLLLVALVQLLSKYNLISRKMRVGVGISLIVIAGGIGIFSGLQEKNETYRTQLAQMFLQGKTLECQVETQIILANKENFNFVSGTFTLIGKENSAFERVMIPLKMCKGDYAESN